MSGGLELGPASPSARDADSAGASAVRSEKLRQLGSCGCECMLWLTRGCGQRWGRVPRAISPEGLPVGRGCAESWEGQPVPSGAGENSGLLPVRGEGLTEASAHGDSRAVRTHGSIHSAPLRLGSVRPPEPPAACRTQGGRGGGRDRDQYGQTRIPEPSGQVTLRGSCAHTQQRPRPQDSAGNPPRGGPGTSCRCGLPSRRGAAAFPSGVPQPFRDGPRSCRLPVQKYAAPNCS